jgi:predicted nucleic acid-binding Zn ribbon protein
MDSPADADSPSTKVEGTLLWEEQRKQASKLIIMITIIIILITVP